MIYQGGDPSMIPKGDAIMIFTNIWESLYKLFNQLFTVKSMIAI